MQNVARVSWFVSLVVLALAMTTLAASLDLDGFFVGDCGVKFIAAKNAIAFPSRPFEIPLPTIGTSRAAEFMEPFWTRHGDHAHLATSPLFPLATAPLIAAFGLPGAYVLPLASFLLLVPATAMLRNVARTSGSAALAGSAAALLTPMVFYGLEYWEHSTAVLCGTLSIALALKPNPRRTAVTMSGALVGVAYLLRPEAVWYALAMVVVLFVLRRPFAQIAAFVAAAMIAAVPMTAYNLLHFGDPWGTHLRNNLTSIDGEWLRVRADILQAWLFNWHTRDSLWRVFPVAALAFANPRIRGRPAVLWYLVLIPLAGAVVTSPNTGGGQWGPRYALMTVPPLLLLSVDAAVRLMKRFAGTRFSLFAGLFVAAAVVAGLFATRASFRELRGSKHLSAEISRAVALTECDYVVTNVWWLDQLAAAASRPRTFLYADRPEQAVSALARLKAHNVTRTVFVRSAEGPAWGIEDGTQEFSIAEVRYVQPRGVELYILVRKGDGTSFGSPLQ